MGTRRKKGKGQTVPPPSLNQSSQRRSPPTQKVKKKKTVTAFTEEQKEKFIEFLMRNEVLYSKRLAGFNDVTQKEAAKINTTVAQLKIWYTSMRTMMGRLKKRAKKSGSGGLAV